MNALANSINQLLPQTQCRDCGFSGCLPYAQAIADDKANINLCSVGGEIVVCDIAQLLQREPVQPEKIQVKCLAFIVEDTCIGCTACIRVCPVDAILGASKQMHTVLADECTGCGLCVAPCPVDCIKLQPVSDDFLPRARVLSESKSTSSRFAAAMHAQARYERRQQRKQREASERQKQWAMRHQATQKNVAVQPEALRTFNPTDLITQAMARAQEQQCKRAETQNQKSFRAEQVRQAQEKATYRRYVRDAKYGQGKVKAAAIAWLRQYQAEQEKAN